LHIDPQKQRKLDNYKLLSGSIVPRPIAFVTSMNKEGIVNASPFSFFNTVASDPPLISISCLRKPGGIMKDTAKNITDSKEFVVHIVDETIIERVNQTSADYPPDKSEVEEVGFSLEPSVTVKVPGIKEAKIRLECRLYQWIPVGDADLLIGEVVSFFIQDELLHEGRIDVSLLQPLSRLAGIHYAKIGETISIPRPEQQGWEP
jgi:flavin reductase (DIM6/NTAB) family NADH-FMN oxidoreductase RutF